MKKLLLAASVLTFSFAANAGTPPADGWDLTNAKCTNLGSKIFKGQTGTVPHVLAMLLNTYSYSSVSFGVTSGTMECDTSRPVAKIRPFVDNNMERLAGAVSRGQGESLDALAALLEIKPEHQTAFNKKLQSEFANIFANDEVTSGFVIAKIVTTLSKDAAFTEYFS